MTLLTLHRSQVQVALQDPVETNGKGGLHVVPPERAVSVLTSIVLYVIQYYLISVHPLILS